MSYNNGGRTENKSPHIAEHPGEKGVCKEQSMWHEEEEETLLEENVMKNTKPNHN